MKKIIDQVFIENWKEGDLGKSLDQTRLNDWYDTCALFEDVDKGEK